MKVLTYYIFGLFLTQYTVGVFYLDYVFRIANPCNVFESSSVLLLSSDILISETIQVFGNKIGDIGVSFNILTKPPIFSTGLRLDCFFLTFRFSIIDEYINIYAIYK